MRPYIVGGGTLAKAIRECCAEAGHTPTAHVPNADVIWIAEDTPIDDDGTPDVEYVHNVIHVALVEDSDAPVLVSSQMPVGTTERLEKRHPRRRFAYCPENVRAAYAVEDFRQQDRIIVGSRDDRDHALYTDLLSPFTDTLIFMSPESAEMTKHAINAYLGMSIAFINEIAAVCTETGADPADVARGLTSDRRTGSYLRPGEPFTTGHLERDIHTLSGLDGHGPLIRSILPSNDLHKDRMGLLEELRRSAA